MADRTFRVEKNRKNAIRVLGIVAEVLDEYKIAYYLDFGTLIGAVRDKGLIPWDDDIDISLLNKEDYHKMPQVLSEIKNRYHLRTYLFTFDGAKEKRRKRGKKIYQEEVSFASGGEYQIAKVRTNRFWRLGRGRSCIDIFFKYTYQDRMCWMAYGQENSLPIDCFCPELVQIDFCGIKTMIPKEYDQYLTCKYGDWKSPHEGWTHESDDLSVNNTGNGDG